MTGIVAMVYDDQYKAHEARAALLRLAGDGYLHIDETAIAIKRLDGTVSVYQDVDVVSKDTNVGHWIGIAAAWLTGTLPWIMVGTIAGKMLGHFTDRSISSDFIKQVEAALTPGTSALFVQGQRTGDLVTVDPVFLDLHRRFGGTILRTTLSPEVERALRHAIDATARSAEKA